MDNPYRRIAVVPDPTAESQPALARAAELAHASGASLELVGIDYNEHIAGKRFGDAVDLAAAREALVQRRRAWLEALAEPYTGAGMEVHCHASFGQPLHDAIIDATRARAPDLIVKDTHYHAPLSRTLFSNTDWELIRRSPIDLLLVKPREWSATPKILSAVDPLHEADVVAALDQAILEQGRVLADVVDGELHVVHVCPQPVPPAVPGYGGSVLLDTAELTRNIERAHRRAVATLIEGREVDGVHIRSGGAPAGLVDLADELHADVMIIGAVSRSGPRRFIGHTARHVLDRLPSDLLIVKRLV